jgi:hypothetical protein
MKEFITGDDIYSTILMFQAGDPRAIVLAEDDSDIDGIVSHLDPVATTSIPCFGSSNLDRAVTLIDSNNIKRVVAIRDRDWHGLLEPEPISPNIILTEYYDFDATAMLTTDAGRRVALVFGDPAKVAAACQGGGVDNPISLVVAAAAAIGYIRLASARNNQGLAVRNFPVHEILDSSGALLFERLTSLVVARTAGCALTESEVAALYQAEVERGVTRERVCSGHDLGAALAALVRRVFGGSAVGESMVLKTLRAALGCAEFRRLRLFNDVQEWEGATGNRIWHSECRVA